jgi:hypothetical protein
MSIEGSILVIWNSELTCAERGNAPTRRKAPQAKLRHDMGEGKVVLI